MYELTPCHYTTLQASTSIEALFPDVLRIARRTGFLKRLRKINPLLFLHALIVASLEAAPSFRLVALTLSLLSPCSVSKQAIAKSMDPECIHFVRGAVFALIQRLSTFHKLRQTQVFQPFLRVLIQD